MALVGQGLAVVPLGIGCQTAHQLERARGLVGELAGVELARVTTPLDWRIVGALDAARMIEASCFAPNSPDQLEGTKRPYWRARRCHFWHDPAGDFGRFSSKMSHLAANWELLSQSPRRVFILSNIQGNLAQKARDPGGFDYELRTSTVSAIAAAIGRKFPGSRLAVVTDFDVFLEDDDVASCTERHFPEVRMSWHFVRSRVGGWQGDDRLWDETLRAIFRKGA